MKKEFYMTIGISGSGKSTYLKNHLQETIVCPDDIRIEITGNISDQTQNSLVWKIAKERVIEKLNTLGIAVLDATNVTSKNRKSFMEGLPPNTNTIAIVFPLPQIDEAFRRVQTDILNGINRSNVPFDVIKRQESSYKNGFMNIKTQFDKTLFLKDDLTELIINKN